MRKAICQVSSCQNPEVAHGLCWKHYARKRRHGHMLPRRHYRTNPHCRYCGTEKSEDFYPRYKGICKLCRKVNRVYRTDSQLNLPVSLVSTLPPTASSV
ncbi:MAG: hypothetical protein ACREOO_08415 [bacterium]